MPDPLDSDLEAGIHPEYAQEIGDFYLALRGVGLFLSPHDSALILEWYALGIPLQQVLRGMHAGAVRRAARDLPIRTLKSLQRDVFKLAPTRAGAGRRAALQEASARRIPMDEDAALGYDEARGEALRALIAKQRTRMLELLEAGQGEPALRRCLLSAIEELEVIRRGSWGEGGPVPRMLQVGRRFYEQIWGDLPEVEQQALLEQAQQAVAATSSRAKTPSFDDAQRLEVLRELVIRLLRQRFALFEPSELMALWEEQ